jgi:hypothetical protein
MVFWPWLINIYGNRKFGNHFVSIELRIWCKHCFVFIPSYNLHARLHSRTPIRIFARLTMPQMKILGMSWFVGIGCIGCVRHGYPWVPTDQAHGRPRQVSPAYQKTRGPVCGPNDLVGGLHDLKKTFQKIHQTTSFRTTTRLDVQDKAV